MTRGFVVGIVKYNNWTFPGPVTVALDCKSVRDFANRNTKYYHYTLTITTTIVPADCGGTGNDTNDPFQGQLRAVLMRPGQKLTVTGHGLGNDIDLDSTQCIGFGPIPTDYQFSILGSNLAGKLTWIVEFDAPHCRSTGITNPDNQVGDLIFSMTYSYDEIGLTTRTITGKAEYAVFITPSLTTITATADDLIDPLFDDTKHFKLLDGFRRRKMAAISPDKRYLDFTITDTEIGCGDNVYPPGVMKVDLKFLLGGMTGNAGIMTDQLWKCGLAGTMEVAPGVSKAYAVDAFLKIAKARAKKLKDVSESFETEGQKTERYLMVTSFGLEDSIYSRQIDLNISFRMAVHLSKLLQDGGVFDPVGKDQGWTWQTWRESQGVKEALEPRAYAKLRSNSSDEVIVSFCQPANFGTADIQREPEQSYVSDFTGDELTEENSWLKYQVDVDFEKTSATIMHRPASASTDSQNPMQPTNYGDKSELQGGTQGLDPGQPGYVSPGDPNALQPVSIQERAPAEVIVTLTGYAVRVGFPINKDASADGKTGDLAYIEKINGQNANEIHSKVIGPRRIGFSPEKSSTGRRIPIYMVAWRRHYRAMSKDAKPTLVGIPESRKEWVKFPT